MTYSDKLKDPRWQKKRLEVLQRDNWTCTECGSTKATLHVHHKNYSYDVNPWDYQDRILVTLCESCHEFEEVLKADNGLYEQAKAGNITCIRIWRIINTFSFAAKYFPDKYRVMLDNLNDIIVVPHKKELTKHVMRPLEDIING